MKDKIEEILIKFSDSLLLLDINGMSEQAWYEKYAVLIDETVTLLHSLPKPSPTNNYANMRHDACKVREEIAIKYMLETWCDIEVTEIVIQDAIKEFRNKYPL